MIDTETIKTVGVEPFAWLDRIAHYQLKFNDVDGDIAAVKKLVSGKNIFLNDGLVSLFHRFDIIDDYDLTGLSVMDLMHNPENKQFYNQRGSDSFKNVVSNILNDNNYEISIKTVKTYNDNTTLRMKHTNSDYSQNYKDSIVSNPKPVVFQTGINSNLESVYDFAKEIASEGRDSWKIELIGGPTTEDCQYGCPNFTFKNLTEWYWPTLVAGVEQYSGQDKIDYIGHSMGCTVGLESLRINSNGRNNIGFYLDDNGQWQLMDLSANPVDTFVAITCPGNYTRLPYLIDVLNITAPLSIFRLRQGGVNHISSKDFNRRIANDLYFASRLAGRDDLYNDRGFLLPIFKYIFVGDEKMSLNIYEDLITWINDPDGPQIGKNVTVPNFLIVQADIEGSFIYDSIAPERDDNTDLFVPIQDESQICNNVQSNNKWYVGYTKKAHNIISDSNLNKLIIQYLKNTTIKISSDYTINFNNCSQIG